MEQLSKKDLDRFFSKMKMVESGCVEWQGSSTNNGYCQININRRSIYVHRLSYELSYGPIADGLQVDHLCNNRICVNPFHLRICTPRENVIASHSMSGGKHNKQKTHCPFGHEYTLDNTYIITRGSGLITRRCKTCKRIKCIK